MGREQIEKIKELLDKTGVQYRIFEHESVYTSEQAARVRGVELKTGVKAIVFKTNDDRFILGLIAADLRIDAEKLADAAGVDKVKLANPEEVLLSTGCEIGSVHPFGVVMGLATYMDRSVLENEQVNFNIGLHEVSMQIASADLVKVLKPTICDVAN